MLDLIPDTKYLITLDHWFYAPNGSQYNAVWGTVVESSPYTEYAPFIRIGENKKEVQVLVSRVQTIVRSEGRPEIHKAYNDKFENGHNHEYLTPTRIYIAE